MNFLRRFMYGRYGTDELNKFIILVMLILMVINWFLASKIIHTIIVLGLIYTLARSLSRSIYNRQRENMKFLEIKDNIFNRKGKAPNNFSGFKQAKNDGKRILICPYCGEKLRVPVGAGKINIQCPHCKQKFTETV